MIELKECCRVPFPEKLFEEYEIEENAIYANINASKVLDMMKCFIKMHNERLFFILELPCAEYDNITESKILRKTYDDRDIYFTDGLDAQQAEQWLDVLGAFLIKDGMNTFGIGGHESHEEILFGKYNVMTIFTKSPERYSSFFEGFGIKRTDALVTAWSTFAPGYAGECERYVSEETGKNVYDIPKMFEKYGMYLYETRRGYDESFEKEIKLEDLLGKVLLVGVTYFNSNEELIEQKQFFGTVTEANSSIIRIQKNDGTVMTLPPDLSSTKRALPGEYTLRSTGEVVVDPDFLTTWTCSKADNK